MATSIARGAQKEGIRCPEPHPQLEGRRCDELLIELRNGVLGIACRRGDHFQPLDVLHREAVARGYVAKEPTVVSTEENTVTKKKEGLSLIGRILRGLNRGTSRDKDAKPWYFKEGPVVTVFVEWQRSAHDEAQQRYLEEFPDLPGADRPPSFWTAKQDAKLAEANLQRRTRLSHGSTYPRFEEVVQELLSTLPCVRQSFGVGGDPLFSAGSFSALVTDPKEFKDAARYIIKTVNRRIPNSKFKITGISVRDRF